MKRSITAALLSALLAVPAMPQQQSPPAPESATAATPKGVVKFSTTRQLVVVDVTAKDKSGNAMSGLKPSDFTIMEDGKKQEISVFEYQELEETLAARPSPCPPSSQAQAIEAPVRPAGEIAHRQPDRTSRKPGEVKYKDRRLLVMFFDMTSMPIQDQVRAQTAAKKFLTTQMQPERPDGDHDLQHRSESAAGFHRR